MVCRTIKTERGYAIVCGPRKSIRRCACGRPATKLCDHPAGNEKTCDKPLCDRCAVRRGPNVDWCREHREFPA